jgi:hypothetical protein
MNLALVLLTSTVDNVLDRCGYTLGKVASHPLAKAYLPQFEAQQEKCFGVDRARKLLESTIARCRGAEGGADDALDDFVDLFDRTLLILVKNDRTAAIYLLYFGKKTASALKRPILADELATVRAWLPSIHSSLSPAIAVLAAQLMAVLAAADEAVAGSLAAKQALKDFDAIGPKKELIDGFNALCKTVYGELAALPHKHPEAMLPTSFADRFFPHESRSGLASITGLKEIDTLIGSLKEDLTAAEGQKQKILDKAATKAANDERARLAAEVVAGLKAEEEELTRKRKAAEKALDDARKGKGPKLPPDATE